MNELGEIHVIEIEGEEWGRIHKDILGSSPLPFTDNKDNFNYQLSLLILGGARRYALRRLAMRNYSSRDIRSQLKKKIVPDLLIDQVIDELTKAGYCNDQEWVGSFIRNELNRKSGPRLIQSKLIKKGFTPDEIQEALQSAKLSQNNQIAKLLSTRYRSKDLNDKKEFQKVVAGLIRKGFDLEEILREIKESKKSCEDD